MKTEYTISQISRKTSILQQTRSDFMKERTSDSE